MNWYAWVGLIFGGVVTLGSAALAGYFSLKAQRVTVEATNKIQEQKNTIEAVSAEGEAFARARETYKDIIDSIQEEMIRLQEKVKELQTQLKKKDDRETELEAQLDSLQIQVSNMREILKKHQIDYDAEIQAAQSNTTTNQGAQQ